MTEMLGFNEPPLKRTKFGNIPTSLSFPGKNEVKFKSKLEANWALYLQFLKDAQEIIDWEYEPERLVFEGETQNPRTWTPDFYVYELDGSETIHECKGPMFPMVNSKARNCKARWDNKIWLIFATIDKKKIPQLKNSPKYFDRIIDANKEIFRGTKHIINYV